MANTAEGKNTRNTSSDYWINTMILSNLIFTKATGFCSASLFFLLLNFSWFNENYIR